MRAASVKDVLDMEEVERLAFPTLFPPTRFRREIDKSNTLYLIAVRDWTEDWVPRAEGGGGMNWGNEEQL